MPDERARATIRAVATSHDVEARARALADRVRAGEVASERVRAAAYAGHEVARHVLGAAAPTAPARLDRFVAGVADLGVPAVVVAGLGVLRAAEPSLGLGPTAYLLFMSELGALWRWAGCPCAEHAAALDAPWAAHALGGFVRWLCAAGARGSADGWERFWARPPRRARRADRRGRGHLTPGDVLRDDPARARGKVVGHLVHWALGE